MKKVLVLRIILIIIVGIGLYIVNCPFDVNKTFDAVEIDLSDEDYVVKREITFTGKYRVNIFEEDTFSGKISVSGYESEMYGKKMFPCRITRKDSGASILFEGKDSDFDLSIFGSLFSGRFLKNMVIIVGDSYSTVDAVCIVAGTDSRDEAMEQVNKLFSKRFHWE